MISRSLLQRSATATYLGLLGSDGPDQLPNHRGVFGFRGFGQVHWLGYVLPTGQPFRPVLLRSFPGIDLIRSTGKHWDLKYSDHLPILFKLDLPKELNDV